MPRITSANSNYITTKELADILKISSWMILRDIKASNNFIGFTPQLLNSKWIRWKKEDVPFIEAKYLEMINDGSFSVKKEPEMKKPRLLSDDSIIEVTTTAKIGTLRMTWREIKEIFDGRSDFSIARGYGVCILTGKAAEMAEELNKFGRWQCEDNGATFFFYLDKA